MAYSTNITLLDTEGGASTTADVTARVWMSWSVLGTGTGTGNLQQEEGSAMGLVKKDLSAPLLVNFPGPTNFAYASRSVALSVQDTNRVANDTGWLFRSGAFPDDLPAEPIEIVTATRRFTSTEVSAMLPALPFTADPGTTTIITAVTLTFINDAIDIAATGTTMATGTLLTFTAMGQIMLSPSTDVRAAETESLNAAPRNMSVTFAPGTNVIATITASVLNAFSGFVLTRMRPRIQEALEKGLNAEIAKSIGRALQTGDTLPPAVVLSIRSTNITADPGGVLEVRGALGAFGGVFSKLPPIQVTPGTGGGRCFIATAVHGADSPEVRLLRAFRDDHLKKYFAGRGLVSLYETVSPPIANYIVDKPPLKAIARALVVTPGARIAKMGIWMRGKRN